MGSLYTAIDIANLLVNFKPYTEGQIHVDDRRGINPSKFYEFFITQSSACIQEKDNKILDIRIYKNGSDRSGQVILKHGHTMRCRGLSHIPQYELETIKYKLEAFAKVLDMSS